MDRNIPLLSRDSPVKLQVGFLVEIVIIIVGMALGYSAIRNDITAAIAQGRENQSSLRVLDLTIQKLSLDIAVLGQRVEDLHSAFTREEKARAR